MGETFDVAVVGAGPAGISAACTLAEKGVKTIVFERGEYPGAKNMFGGVLYGHDLARILPDYQERKCPVERNVVESRLWYLSKDGGYSLSYRDRAFTDELKQNVFTVGRAKFDRWFADQAKSKGALVVCATVVTDLIRDGGGRVIGVRTDRPDGDLHANVVLLADGINSPLARKTGFRAEPRPENVALAVKELIELPEEVIDARFNVEPGNGVTTEILGEPTWGMNGVAFLYTNKSSISLGIGANLADFARHKARPYEMLEALKSHPMVAPLIKEGKPKEYLAHWLAEGGYETVPKLCGDGFLIAGDSAMFFNALHREGSNLAMTSGRFAAHAILDALNKGDFSARALESYVERLQESYVLQDLKKYRRFPSFLEKHEELFSTLPGLASLTAREMLTVDGVPKKKKQHMVWKAVRSEIPLRKLLRLAWDGWRSVR
ncbi:FAD-dependent oxidoreductase [Desulforhabdus amnigena]|jgi:electron transfer flavoprotein-quinone oxidoreductase|uniref:Protein FixC n=1 Tax=Desulforhabdus amnigena TaxID=40218 RepID=A0A9W6L9J2_9BACT|nr:FAD-dependent oxidoreductase [Desulforhabdus amnigena]NLJ27621.1 FAD-binding protein [Deltaproteobacteria bacterium]GLI35146.1 protein FixC [Desulforhabdus amnigena]